MGLRWLGRAGRFSSDVALQTRSVKPSRLASNELAGRGGAGSAVTSRHTKPRVRGSREGGIFHIPILGRA